MRKTSNRRLIEPSRLLKPHSARGTLVLAVAIVSVIVLVIIFLFLNLGALLGTKNEGQTAADAAALFVAREISSLTVDSKLGKIGLVDMEPHDSRNPYFKLRGNDNEAPVIGYNTALATLRLDSLIAEDLDNEDMRDLCKRDLEALKKVSQELNLSIKDSVKTDSPIFTKAKALYEENNRRIGGLSQLAPEGFEIVLGRLSDNHGTTNIPLPAPMSGAGLFSDSTAMPYKTATNETYPANATVAVHNIKFAFPAIGNSPKLVPNSDFVPFDDQKYASADFGVLPCSIVCIKSIDAVRAIAPDGKSNRQHTTLKSQSCAAVGSERLHARSTVYTLGFGGFPSKNAFAHMSIESILDYGNWKNPGEHQSSTWLQAKQGDFPSAGGASAVPLTPVAFTQSKSQVQSPGTALAYGLYDWLRSLRLRPRRDEVAKLFKEDLRKKMQNREFGVDNSDTDAGEENDTKVDDDEDVGTDGDETASDDDESPTMGCMFRPPVGEDPRYAALLAGGEEGTQLYFNAFNYRAIDTEMCPDSSLPIFVDPITGNAKGQSGNDIIELCQLVEGAVASNHAGFTALVAGRQARLDAIEARRANRAIRHTLDDANKTFASLRQDPSNGALAHTLAGQMQSIKGGASAYQNLSLLRTSPASDNHHIFNHTPAEVLQELQHTHFTPGNIRNEADHFLNGQFDLNKVFDEEQERIEAVRRRAGRVRRNARFDMRKSVRLVRRLRKWSNRGVRRLDIYPSADFYPPAPSFAVNIRRPKAKRPQGGHVPTRVVFILPNNGKSVIRNDASARPHFFRLDEVTTNEVANFKQSLEKVEPVADRNKYDRADFEGVEQLESGNSIFPQHKNRVLDVHSQLNPQLKPFARNWDSELAPPDFKVATPPARTGIAFMRLYRRLTVGDRTARTGPFPASMGQYIKLKEFRRQISEAQKGQDEGTGVVEADNDGPDLVPGYEQVFVLSCDGDASFDQAQGQLKINYVRQPRTYDARYPFGTNQLLSQQFLYFAGSAMEDGTPGPDQNHPTTTFRAVIARDQFADLSQGNSYRLQPSQNWCHKEGGYDLTLGRASGECPYPAGEWRLGNAYSIACCRLDPNNLAIKVRPKHFESFLGVESNDGDADDDDVTAAEPEEQDDHEICPLLIKRAARTGKVLGFF